MVRRPSKYACVTVGGVVSRVTDIGPPMYGRPLMSVSEAVGRTVYVTPFVAGSARRSVTVEGVPAGLGVVGSVPRECAMGSVGGMSIRSSFTSRTGSGSVSASCGVFVSSGAVSGTLAAVTVGSARGSLNSRTKSVPERNLGVNVGCIVSRTITTGSEKNGRPLGRRQSAP